MNNTVLKEIRKSLIATGVAKRLANSFTFPEAIEIGVNKDKIVIRLSAKAIGMSDTSWFASNMQKDDAAFEGWAFLIYAHYAKNKGFSTVELDLAEDACTQIKMICKYKVGYTGTRLHYNRFLYRALRFSQQYKEWFALSVCLQSYINEFEAYLKSPDLVFTNNIPKLEMRSKRTLNSDIITENDVQDVFANYYWQQEQGANFCKKYGGRLHRELPTGLFEGVRAFESRAIFPIHNSTIDLWSCDENKLNVFELKYDNKMIGIITELFFYTNYMRDMFCRGRAINFLRQRPRELGFRGYMHLEKASFAKVNGYMLYDKGNLHQAITNDVIDLMNKADFSDAPSFTITYGKIEYEVLFDKEVLVYVK